MYATGCFFREEAARRWQAEAGAQCFDLLRHLLLPLTPAIRAVLVEVLSIREAEGRRQLGIDAPAFVNEEHRHCAGARRAPAARCGAAYYIAS